MRPAVVHALAPYLGHGLAKLIVPGWFGMTALAVLIAGTVLIRQCARRGDDVRLVARTAALAYVVAIACGIAGPSLLDFLTGLAHGRLRLRWAGMTSYCGFVGAMVAVGLYLRGKSISGLEFADRAAGPAGLAIAVVRVGCFMAGCDFGVVTSSPLGLRFPPGSPAFRSHVRDGLIPAHAHASLPVHPTQLYEAALGLLLVVLAARVGRTRWARERRGRVFVTVVAGYAVGRMVIEMFRGDAGRGLWAGLSFGQMFALATLMIIGAALWRQRGRLAVVAATVALGLVAVPIGSARADEPAPLDPYAAPTGSGGQEAPASPGAATTSSAPAPAPAPTSTAGPAAPAPAPATGPGTPAPARPGAPPAVATTASSGPLGSVHSIEVAAFVAGAAPLNRRSGQVPTLAGASLSGAVRFDKGWSLFLDLDSLANNLAGHGSVVFGGLMDWPLVRNLDAGVRLGLGGTLVNFQNPAFADQLAFTARAGAVIDWAITPRFAIEAQPFTLDVISSAALGGPIVTYQFRIGLAFRSKPRRPPPAAPATSAPAAPATPALPVPPPPPAAPATPALPAPGPAPVAPAGTPPDPPGGVPSP